MSTLWKKISLNYYKEQRVKMKVDGSELNREEVDLS